MLYLILHWLVSAIILIVVAYLVPGIFITNFGIALLAVLILGAVNALIRPVLLLLTLPLNMVTMGLFSFVINALMLALTAWLIPGFEIQSFWAALVGAILLTLLNSLTFRLF